MKCTGSLHSGPLGNPSRRKLHLRPRFSRSSICVDMRWPFLLTLILRTHHIGPSRMSLRILPPANSQERWARQRVLGAVRQQGLEVRAFTQIFWTMSRGLEYQDSALKDIFNLCLDNPLPQWNSWGFWNFSNYVHHCKVWQILLPPESTCTDQPTVPISDRPILIFLNRYRDRLFACYCTR